MPPPPAGSVAPAMCCCGCRSRCATSSANGCKANFPDRERHVFALIRQTRGGKDYDSTFGKRMTGGGPYAWMIGKRFDTTCARLGLNVHKTELTTAHFQPPRARAEQLDLF